MVEVSSTELVGPKSRKVNVGIPEKCMDAIVELIDNTRAFTSKSDVVCAALRELLFWYSRNAEITYEEIRASCPDDTDRMFTDEVKGIFAEKELNFKKKFGSRIKTQIAITIPNNMYERVEGMLFVTDDDIGRLCRVAIFLYFTAFEDESGLFFDPESPIYHTPVRKEPVKPIVHHSWT